MKRLTLLLMLVSAACASPKLWAENPLESIIRGGLEELGKRGVQAALEPKPEAPPDELETHLNEATRLTAILNAEAKKAREGGPPMIYARLHPHMLALTAALQRARYVAEKSGIPEKIHLVAVADLAAVEAIGNTGRGPWSKVKETAPTAPEPTTKVIRIQASTLPATYEDKGRRYEFHGCESRPGEPTYEDLVKAEHLTQIMSWRYHPLDEDDDKPLTGRTQIIVCKFRITNVTPEIFAFLLNDKGKHWALFDDRGATYHAHYAVRDPGKYHETEQMVYDAGGPYVDKSAYLRKTYHLIPNKPFDLWMVFAQESYQEIPIGDKSIAQLEAPLELRMPEYEEVVPKFLGPIALTPGQGSLRW